MLAHAPAAAADFPGGSRGFSLGVLTGSSRFDSHLADYQWDLTPHVSWGVQALAGSGRFAAGLRAWSAQATQRLDVPGATGDASVGVTSVELVAQGNLVRAWGTDVLGIASGGRMRLAYRPDRLTIPASGGGSPITVELAPVDEWIGGAGLGFRHALPGPWFAGLEFERRVFGLDTAHRNGGGIEYRRESFGDWAARLELARRFGHW